MSINLDTKTNTYTVQYQKRCPKRGYPVPLRRTGIKSQAEAKRVEKELIWKVQEKLNEQISPTLSQVIEEFCVYKKELGQENSTIHTYDTCFRKISLPLLKFPINRIDKFQILKIIDAPFEGKSSYLEYFFKCCRGTFRFAVDKGYCDKDPTPYRKVKKAEKIKTVLTEDQVVEFLAQAKLLNSPWYSIWVTALYTGLRNGELHALTWDKVNFDNNTILINCSWGKRNGLKSTKSGDDRTIQISSSLKPILLELKHQSGGAGFVLPRLQKWEMGEQSRELKMFLLGNNLPVITFHSLRATWATILLSKGTPAAKVMAIGGWKDIKTMMIYIRKAGIDTKGALDCLVFANKQ